MGSLLNEINRNYNLRINNSSQPNNVLNSKPQVQNTHSLSNELLKNDFYKEKSKNGLIEKVYDFLKNKTGLGIGSKKLENAIKLNAEGKKSQEEVKNEILKYRTSQKTAQQAFGDFFAITLGYATFSQINNFLLKECAENKVGKSFIRTLIEEINYDKKFDKIIEFFTKLTPSKRIGIALVGTVLTSSWIKKFILKINRTGSKEFKIDKNKTYQTKKEKKAEKKALKKAKRKENRKNFLTGALYGVLTPLIGLGGGFVGVPAIILANLGIRYATTQKDNKINFNDFKQKLADNAGITAAAALLTSLPLFKKAQYNKLLKVNLEKVVNKLKDAKLTNPFKSEKTAYMQLEELVLGDKKLDLIIEDYKLPVEEKIRKLTEENIFAVKFLQISNNRTKLGEALKENCPSSRTIEEAKEYISKVYKDRFDISKQLGVGTVAETYLAKDNSTGKEVCIKIIKKGINAEKIDSDMKKIINLIKMNITDNKEKEYLIKNIRDLADGIRKEVDLKNEMDAAKKLNSFTKKAFVVKPIEIKDNVYIMEKAKGISLKTLQDFINIKSVKQHEIYRAKSKNTTPDIQIIKYFDEEIAKIKAKSPDFDEIDITPSEIDKILSNYINAITEQFESIQKAGKTIHADIHPGNVFIDLKGLKEGKRKIITLIDTGNTIDMSMQQSKTALKLNQYIKNGNIKDLAAYVTENAILPENITKQQSTEIVEKELKELFFNNKNSIEYMNNNSFLKLTANIMKKHNIIPSDTQLNHEKAKLSAMKSMLAVVDSLIKAKYSNIDIREARFKIISDVASWSKRIILAQKLQELHNITQYSFKQIIKNLRNPNMLKTNSEEYLTYKLKQSVTNNPFFD